jgi:hypothetical protein
LKERDVDEEVLSIPFENIQNAQLRSAQSTRDPLASFSTTPFIAKACTKIE